MGCVHAPLGAGDEEGRQEAPWQMSVPVYDPGTVTTFPETLCKVSVFSTQERVLMAEPLHAVTSLVVLRPCISRSRSPVSRAHLPSKA